MFRFYITLTAIILLTQSTSQIYSSGNNSKFGNISKESKIGNYKDFEGVHLDGEITNVTCINNEGEYAFSMNIRNELENSFDVNFLSINVINPAGATVTLNSFPTMPMTIGNQEIITGTINTNSGNINSIEFEVIFERTSNQVQYPTPIDPFTNIINNCCEQPTTSCLTCDEESNLIINPHFNDNLYTDRWARNLDGNAGFYIQNGFLNTGNAWWHINGNKFAIRQNSAGIINTTPDPWLPGVSGRGGNGMFFIYQYGTTTNESVLWQQREIDVTPGETYCFCFWTRKLNFDPAIQNPSIRVQINVPNTRIEIHLVDATEICWDNDWFPISATWTCPSGITKINISIYTIPIDLNAGGNANPCPIGIGVDDISFCPCGETSNNFICPDARIIGTDITLCTGQTTNLNCYIVSKQFPDNLELKYLNGISIVDPAITPPTNTVTGLISNKSYLVYPEIGNAIYDGGNWGRQFDAEFFINAPENCINGLNPIITMDGNNPIGFPDAPIIGNDVIYNRQYHTYYYIVNGATELTITNLFSPLCWENNGSSLIAGNRFQQTNRMIFKIFELCDTNGANIVYDWKPIEGNNVELDDIRNPIFPSGLPPGIYNYQLTAYLPSGVVTDKVGVTVTDDCSNDCCSLSYSCNNPVIIGTDITLCGNQSANLNCYVVNSTSVGNLMLPHNNAPSVLNPDLSSNPPINNQMNGLDPGKEYLLLPTANKKISDGGGWGRGFDSEFFINYPDQCINQIKRIITKDGGFPVELSAPISGNDALYNEKYNSYYYIANNTTSLTVSNLFEEICWQSSNANSLLLGNKGITDLTFTVYEICNVTPTYQWIYTDGPTSFSPLANNNTRNPLFNANQPPGTYNFKIIVTLPDGSELSKKVNVLVKEQCISDCCQ